MRKLLSMVLAALFLLAATCSAEVGMANPWTETDADGLMETLGLALGVPEGATDVSWRMMEEGQMGELTFKWNDMEYTARVAPTDGFEDISGVYCEWDQSVECSVGRCDAVDYRGQDGEEILDVCLWYDDLTGLMYSLYTSGADLDGFDILAAAEQVYVPMQTE